MRPEVTPPLTPARQLVCSFLYCVIFDLARGREAAPTSVHARRFRSALAWTLDQYADAPEHGYSLATVAAVLGYDPARLRRRLVAIADGQGPVPLSVRCCWARRFVTRPRRGDALLALVAQGGT
jgi:hypothetical protein